MNQTAPPPIPRETIPLNADWTFHLGENTDSEAPEFDPASLRLVDLPHDWSIEQTPTPDGAGGAANGFFPGGVGWYGKKFIAPADWAGRLVSIEFDGIYQKSDVYLNDQLLGHRPYGYVGFTYDLTPYLEIGGENTLAVRVDHGDAPTSRWYSGSGIYRDVRLHVTDPLHIAHWGTFVTTPRISDDAARIRVRTTVRNGRAEDSDCVLTTTIRDAAGHIVVQAKARRFLSAGGEGAFDATYEVNFPIRWTLERPHLYTVQTTVSDGTAVVDETQTFFGIREATWDPYRGFLLNGEKVVLKGVCVHGDGGSVGAAVPPRVWERRLEALRAIGCNALRMSHNPPAAYVLDMCDRMGLLVIDESFDKWRSGSYGASFDEWWERDLDAMLRRDRNHPCVILWSVGNEVAEQGTPGGTETLKMLVDHVHRADPSRGVTCAAFPNRGPEGSVNANGFADAMDVVSYNYSEPWYDEDKGASYRRVILGSECYPYFRGRAEYDTTRPVHNVHTDFAPVNPWFDVTSHEYVAGQFLWVGIDYLGESAGWPSKGWPNGLIDTCGFAKARAGFHKCAWRTDPQIALAVLDDALAIDPGRAAWSWPKTARHWNFPEYAGGVIRVETFTNCQTVELLLNGESFGTRRASDYPNGVVLWYIPYQPGTLEAIGKNGGAEVALDTLRTAGAATAIALRPDRTRLRADGEDMAHIEIDLTDADGVRVPNNDRLIHFTVAGPARLIGVDNGDLRSAESYKGSERTTYFGRALALVQASREAGTTTFTATADGLPPATVTLEAVD